MNNKLTGCKSQLQTYKDSVAVLQSDILEVSHFNLDRNEDAITYFENKGYNIDELIPFIKDELYKLNAVDGDHPMVPYAASEGRKMMINTIKMLNHKWIIADFSDGQYWGELFLTYEITQSKELKFNLVEYFLYPFY
jgi:hypothetical protein